MVFVRGQAQDYDTWAQLGNRGWSYRDVLPIFRDMESFQGDADEDYRGRNGPLKTKEVETSPLRAPGKPYEYKAGFINNLDGSGGLIKNHGDVTNEAVTYAFASAIAST